MRVGYLRFPSREGTALGVHVDRASLLMLHRFYRTFRKPPDQVTATEVLIYAHGTGLCSNSNFWRLFKKILVVVGQGLA